MNDITTNEEKWRGNKRSEKSLSVLTSFISNNQLVDIGFEARPWTWCNNWGQERDVKGRLDRILSNKEWRAKHRKAKCNHIQNEALDH